MSKHARKCMVIVMVSIATTMLRHAFLTFRSYDYEAYLEPWYNEIVANGKVLALKDTVGNYNLLYQTIIALLTYLPINPLQAYKWLSVLFDFGIAFATMHVLKKWGKSDRQQLLGYGIVLVLPTAVMNSAMWGQCDSIYTFFVILFAIALFERKPNKACIWLGIALAFKLQAVFAFPFLVFSFWFLNHEKPKLKIWHFLWIPITMFLSGIVCYLAGQRDFFKVFKVYLNQTEEYPYLYANYPSFWTFFSIKNGPLDGYVRYGKVALVFTIVALGALVFVLGHCSRSSQQVKAEYAWIILFILVYTCVMFLPSMHERYGYVYEILAVLLCFIDEKTVPLCIALQVISCMTYLHFLIGWNNSILICAGINVLVYACYLLWMAGVFKREIRNEIKV